METCWLNQNSKVSRLHYQQALVTAENINRLISDLKLPADLDLFSLDIDYNTYHVWAKLTDLHPRVVVIEYNPIFPPSVEWTTQYSPDKMWDGTTNYGASLKSLELLGRKLEYSLVGCELAGSNAFFVRNDLVGDHFEGPYTSENHYHPARFHLWHSHAIRRGLVDNVTTSK